ncbi:hypothetical protein BC829DRAFT_441054 [Chytridium lagenaria]|nr:hypothetical protein BC829DRAFT_441054 [Chytridium lagenaria]
MQDHLSPLLASYCLPVLRKLLRSYDGISDLPSRRSVEQAVLACDFVNDLINVKPPSSSVSPSPLSPPASPPFLCDTPLVLQFPPEILFNIFAVLKRDRSTLAACAVVCQIWNPLAVQSLYSSPFQDKDISGLTNCSAALINSVMGVHPVAPKVDPGTLMMKLALGLKDGRLGTPFEPLGRCCPKLIGFSITFLKITSSHLTPLLHPLCQPRYRNPLSISAAPIFTLTHPPDNSPSDLISDRDMRDLGESISRLHYLLCEVPSASPLANQVASTFTSTPGTSHSVPGSVLTLRSYASTECLSIDDNTLSVIPLQCPNLRILDLWGSPSVSDLSVTPIIKSCTKIEAIDITFTSILSANVVQTPRTYLCGCLETGRDVDDVLAAIAEWAVELRQLDVVGCVGPPPAEEETTTMPRISGERVRRVMERCGRLETFAWMSLRLRVGFLGS